MSTTADRTIAALRHGHDDLATRVAGYGPDELARRSGASEWTVAQVLSHLGSGAELGLATLDAAIVGGPVPGDDFNRDVWGRWDAMGPSEHARLSIAANERLVERFESLTDDQRSTLKIDLAWAPAPVDVATDACLRLSEFALHSWDVAVAFDPDATLTPEATALLLDHAATLSSFAARPDALDGRRVHLAVEVTDPSSRFGLLLDDPISIGEPPAEPDGTLRAPAEAWLRLLTGRLGPDNTPAGVEVTGPLALDDLRRLFPGF